MQGLQPTELARFESLGDNCELGFVLRRLGYDGGSLFKWALSEPTQILNVLRHDFAALYEFEALSSFRGDMVREARYGICWHSTMHSSVVAGAWQFRDDEATRAMLHWHESRKMRYLVGKLRARLAGGGVIAVVKSNDGIGPDVVNALFVQLSRRARRVPFTLLEVQAAPSPDAAGRVEVVQSGLLRGYVSRFADYNAADHADYDSWQRVLAAALALSPCPDWSSRAARSAALIDGTLVTLNFPGVLEKDPRGGVVTLTGGNTWCRAIDERYRLHAAPPPQAPAMLRWTGVQAPARSCLSGLVNAAAEDSLPVELVVALRQPNGGVGARQSCLVYPGRPASFTLDLADHPPEPSTAIEITAQAERPIASGERAVIDISLLSLEAVGAV